LQNASPVVHPDDVDNLARRLLPVIDHGQQNPGNAGNS
jgi:hypothetical protein